MESDIFAKVLNAVSQKEVVSVNVADYVTSLSGFVSFKLCVCFFRLKLFEKLHFFV